MALFAPVFGWAVLALGMGVRRFWRGVTPGGEMPGAAVMEATHDALRLRYLDGGHGQGCHDADDRTTHWRRRFHHLTAGGFGLCFASTTIATTTAITALAVASNLGKRTTTATAHGVKHLKRMLCLLKRNGYKREGIHYLYIVDNCIR